jgi:hypothetical protein
MVPDGELGSNWSVDHGDSDAGGDFVEKSGYRLQSPVRDDNEVSALDHVSFGLRTQRPGKTHLVVMAVGAAFELETEAGDR